MIIICAFVSLLLHLQYCLPVHECLLFFKFCLVIFFLGTKLFQTYNLSFSCIFACTYSFCRFDNAGATADVQSSVTLLSPTVSVIPLFPVERTLDADFLAEWIKKSKKVELAAPSERRISYLVGWLFWA